jgi:hypothetical protein
MRFPILRQRSRADGVNRPVRRSNWRSPSIRRKNAITRIVIAASRLLSADTVRVFASLAASPTFDGRLEAASLSFWVMSNFWLSSRNSPLSLAHCRRSWT